jgi:hypothetical protein
MVLQPEFLPQKFLGKTAKELGEEVAEKVSHRAAPELNHFPEAAEVEEGAAELANRSADFTSSGQPIEMPVQQPYAPVQITPTEGRTPDRLFDESKSPNVPQTPLERYRPLKGASQRILGLTGRPDVRDGVMAAVRRGMERDAHNWFNAEPLRLEFVKEFGEEEGTKRFRLYIAHVAASSPQSKVGENIRNASYYYARNVSGELLPLKNPSPYGHLKQKLHRSNDEKVRSGVGFDPTQAPKQSSYEANLLGNWVPVTVDTHAFRLLAMLAQDPKFLVTSYKASKHAPLRNIKEEYEQGKITMDELLKQPAYWQSRPRRNEYAELERFYQDIAGELGLSPAQVQAAAWVGGAELTGLASHARNSFMGFLKDRIALTAAKRGMSENEVLKRMMHGTLPGGGLLTLVGAPPMLAHLLSQRGGEKREGISEQRL